MEEPQTAEVLKPQRTRGSPPALLGVLRTNLENALELARSDFLSPMRSPHQQEHLRMYSLALKKLTRLLFDLRDELRTYIDTHQIVKPDLAQSC